MNRINGNGNSNQKTTTDRNPKKTKTKPRANLKSQEKANPEAWATLVIKKAGPFRCVGKDKWWQWNGRYWQEIDPKQEIAKVIWEAQGTRCKRNTRKSNEIERTINILSQEPGFKISDWRRGIWFEGKDLVMIACQNGVVGVNLTTKEVNLYEQQKEFNVSMLLPVTYDPEAKCETFDYLRESCLPDAKDRILLQLFAGYCLMPDHRFQCALFCHGAPNTGKSLLVLHGIGSVFDRESLSCISLDQICSGGEETKCLETALMNIATEKKASKLLEDQDIFNKMVCGEAFNKAFKYETVRLVIPLCKHIFVQNDPAKWKRGSESEARRIRLIHFPVDFSNQPKNAELEKKVSKEGSGVFNWMIEGLLGIIGLDQLPMGGEESQLWMEAFKKHNNPVGTFVKEFCEVQGEDVCKRHSHRKNRQECHCTCYREEMPKFRNEFWQWCEQEGIYFDSNRVDFSRVLLQLMPKLKIIPVNKVRKIFGIRLSKVATHPSLRSELS